VKISVVLKGIWIVPYVFWFVGGTDPGIYMEAKKNKHDPRKSFPQICNCNKSNIKNWFAVTEERCTIMAELKMTAL
jgi:hypothetical protein